VLKILQRHGLTRVPVDSGVAGDIVHTHSLLPSLPPHLTVVCVQVSVSGLSAATVGDTICALDVTEPLPVRCLLRASQYFGFLLYNLGILSLVSFFSLSLSLSL
jgi:hypothetical protein